MSQKSYTDYMRFMQNAGSMPSWGISPSSLSTFDIVKAIPTHVQAKGIAAPGVYLSHLVSSPPHFPLTAERAPQAPTPTALP